MTTRLTEPRFVVDETGTKVAVVLPIDVYEELVEQLEQQDDLKAIKAALKDSERIPWEQVKTEIYTPSHVDLTSGLRSSSVAVPRQRMRPLPST